MTNHIKKYGEFLNEIYIHPHISGPLKLKGEKAYKISEWDNWVAIKHMVFDKNFIYLPRCEKLIIDWTVVEDFEGLEKLDYYAIADGPDYSLGWKKYKDDEREYYGAPMYFTWFIKQLKHGKSDEYIKFVGKDAENFYLNMKNANFFIDFDCKKVPQTHINAFKMDEINLGLFVKYMIMNNDDFKRNPKNVSFMEHMMLPLEDNFQRMLLTKLIESENKKNWKNNQLIIKMHNIVNKAYSSDEDNELFITWENTGKYLDVKLTKEEQDDLMKKATDGKVKWYQIKGLIDPTEYEKHAVESGLQGMGF